MQPRYEIRFSTDWLDKGHIRGAISFRLFVCTLNVELCDSLRVIQDSLVLTHLDLGERANFRLNDQKHGYTSVSNLGAAGPPQATG